MLFQYVSYPVDKDSQQQHADKNIEHDPGVHNHRHFAPHSEGQNKHPVLDDEESHHMRDDLSSGDDDVKASKEGGEGDDEKHTFQMIVMDSIGEKERPDDNDCNDDDGKKI